MSYENFIAGQKNVVAALRQMGAAATAHGLDHGLVELVKIRVSQINGCAFCLQYHLNMARQYKVDERKLGLLATWRDAGVFSDQEMAALAYAERLTLLAHQHLGATDRPVAGAALSASEIEHLTIAIATINAWNRIAAALHFTPPD